MGNKFEIKGKAWRFDDNISTDDIISGVHLAKLTIEELKPYAFETLHPEFAMKVHPNDLVVGGRNFGVGSSREEAPAVLQALEIGAVIAASFARIFFRNSFNVGLPAVEVPALADEPDLIRNGDPLHLQLQQGILLNQRTNQTLKMTRIPSFLLTYIQAGGAIQLLKQKLANK